MGQKVNPHGLRVGVIKDWDSRWFTTDKKEFGNLLLEDHNVRNFLKKRLYSAGVAKIEIERSANKLKLDLHVAKPGVVIGKAGAGIDALKAELEKMTKKTVIVNIVEVRNPDKDAQLVAENIALAIERRVAFRRAMKQAIQRKCWLRQRHSKRSRISQKQLREQTRAKRMKRQLSGKVRQ